MKNEKYLGDGLYVSFDGWQFCLRAPREEGDHVIYMDQHILKNFSEYCKLAVEREESI